MGAKEAERHLTHDLRRAARSALLIFVTVLTVCAIATPTPGDAATYTNETRSLVSGGTVHTYLLAAPSPMPPNPALVILLHGDGGSAADIRAELPLEAEAAGRAVFTYPMSDGGAFEYWSEAGRASEATFIGALIAAVHAEFDIDTNRVYLGGMSGGATMANALGCRLGAGVIRKLAIHSGSLYPVNGDFGYTANGGVDCDMPGTILIWGKADRSDGTNFAVGQNVRNNHIATQSCAATTTSLGPEPCLAYEGCRRPVSWCAIDGLGHAIWNQAAAAMWNFFDLDAPAQPVEPSEPAPQVDGSDVAPLAGPTHWVSGYYVGFERDLYPIAEVDFSAITHLIVGRLRPRADGTLTTDFDLSAIDGPPWAHSAVDAAHAAHRKAILMIGGAGEIAGWRGAATAANRQKFVANLLAALDDFDADGLDIDWEPLESDDYVDFIALTEALRAARPTIELTLPLAWINTNLEWNPRPAGEAAFLATIAPLYDQINVMTYEMAAADEGWSSWFASPLTGQTTATPSSVESSVAYYVGAGVPANKLGIGIGFYGNCLRGVTQPRVPVAQPNFIASDGAMSYGNIVSTYLPAMNYTFDPVASAPWLTSAEPVGPQQCNLVTFEDPGSIALKGAFVAAKGLGGTIIWTVAQGHVPTLPAGAQDPLLDAVRAAFLK